MKKSFTQSAEYKAYEQEKEREQNNKVCGEKPNEIVRMYYYFKSFYRWSARKLSEKSGIPFKEIRNQVRYWQDKGGDAVDKQSAKINKNGEVR